MRGSVRERLRVRLIRESSYNTLPPQLSNFLSLSHNLLICGKKIREKQWHLFIGFLREIIKETYKGNRSVYQVHSRPSTHLTC